MKRMKNVIEDKEKAKYLALLLGEDITYVQQYNEKNFRNVSRRYGVLLTKKNECIIIKGAYQLILDYALVENGQENREGFCKYYADKYKLDKIDTDKKWYITKISSRVDTTKKYYVLDDRAYFAERELTQEEKEDINEFVEWYYKAIMKYASKHYTLYENVITFDEK